MARTHEEQLAGYRVAAGLAEPQRFEAEVLGLKNCTHEWRLAVYNGMSAEELAQLKSREHSWLLQSTQSELSEVSTQIATAEEQLAELTHSNDLASRAAATLEADHIALSGLSEVRDYNALKLELAGAEQRISSAAENAALLTGLSAAQGVRS
jgi:hypothetical protein